MKLTTFFFKVFGFSLFCFSGLGRLPNLHLVGSGEETFANVHKFTNFLETVEDFQELSGSAVVFKGPTCQISPQKAILKRRKRHCFLAYDLISQQHAAVMSPDNSSSGSGPTVETSGPSHLLFTNTHTIVTSVSFAHLKHLCVWLLFTTMRPDKCYAFKYLEYLTEMFS